MVNWQVTATTIYCDAVDDEVTLQIFKDWSVKCTGYEKYYQPDKMALKLLKGKSKQLHRQLECKGLECHRVNQYKDKLLSEETEAERSKAN